MRDRIENLEGLNAVDLHESRSLASIAISLKRIADVLATTKPARTGSENPHG